MSFHIQDKKYLVSVYKKYPVCFVKAKGMFLWDTSGKKYMDFLSGVGVNAFGYAHPKITKTINKASNSLIHVSNLFYNLNQIELAKNLIKFFGNGKVFFSNSGAEANECAIKFARKWGTSQHKDKYEIITFENSFHGRTLATISATGQEKMKSGFYPMLKGFKHVKFNDISSLKKAVSKKTCAIMIETIQGEGGVKIADKSFLKSISDICKKNNILLICDEIQSGLGRTGKMFSYENFNINPDIITLAKPLGGGLPLGATLISNKFPDVFVYGSHGSTFGGNSLSCAIGLEVLKLLTKNNLNHITSMGNYFLQKLNILKNNHPSLIKDVRGFGLMCAMELNIEGRSIVEKALEKGFIINVTQNNVIRFLPPYIVQKKHIDSLIKMLDDILLTM
jgi:acetylornithine/N-succinyldiaminopimelate aminotransferase